MPASAQRRGPESGPPAVSDAGNPLGQLQYRFIGPPGNRTSAVVGEPGNPNVYYVGAASGGIWKSIDGGWNWRPIFDSQPAQSIGSLAIAPSDANVIWAGTGEPFIRSNVSIGNGIYKSTDAGRTWAHMGLEPTGRIGRVIVHPANPDIVFAAALGHCYGPQQERGVYRTLDGGKTWDRVLFIDENTGVADLAMDPGNPRILIAGTWTIDIKTWGRTSGGPAGGVFISRDGGTTWRKATRGLPAPPLGKIAVAIAPSLPNRMYALIETGDRGSLWRSDDGGESWRVVNHSRLLNERPHYYTRMLVMPDDANEVYFPSNGMSVTYDGGETTESINWFGDNHDMWADPKDPSRIMIGHDLGVSITTTRGRGWSAQRLPIGQMYHVATDNRIPYFVYGQMQDYSSVRGPSNSITGSISASQWTTTAGCETGWNIPDPVDNNIIWGGCYAGAIERFDLRTRQSRTVSPWPERTMGAPAGAVELRMNWTPPLVISPHDHNTVYVGSQYVHRTSDGGQTWTKISPDLSLNDRDRLGDSGGLTLDNLSVEYYSAVFAIAESPVEKGQIWAGTNDGQVQVTRNGGEAWTNVTANIPGMPPQMTVSSIEPSRHAAGTCYIAVDGHQVNNRDPWLFRTSDYGKTWKNIGNGIPKSVFSYTHVLREDPVRQGLLYAGTENGLYVSFDDGATWRPLQNNLPHAPVHWLTIQPHFNDLVVGTYGRGFYILDDLTPLQQMTPDGKTRALQLFAPRQAYRFRNVERRDLAMRDSNAGQNPPYGASINYALAAPATGPVRVTISDASGKVVRTLTGPGMAGVNRLWWDLRHESLSPVRLRTTPPGNPHIWEEKRFKGLDARGVFYYAITEQQRGPMVPPGVYTVKVTAGGQDATEKLTVLKDPASAGTEAGIAAATELSLAIYRDSIESVEMINRIEWARKQIEDLKKMLAPDARAAGTVADLAALDGKLLSVEDKLLQRTLADGDQKSFRGPLQLYLTLLWLQAEVGSGGGDIAGNADYPPTAAQLEVYAKLKARLAAIRTEFGAVVEKDVPAFNSKAKDAGVGAITVPRMP